MEHNALLAGVVLSLLVAIGTAAFIWNSTSSRPDHIDASERVSAWKRNVRFSLAVLIVYLASGASMFWIWQGA